MTLRVIDPHAFWTPDDCQQLTGFDFAVHEMSPNSQLDLQQQQRHAAATSLSTFPFILDPVHRFYSQFQIGLPFRPCWEAN